MQLNIRVVPNAKRFSVKVTGDEVRIYLKEKAEDGKANLELVKSLKRLLGVEVQLLRGQKSRVKIIGVNADEETVWRILREASE